MDIDTFECRHCDGAGRFASNARGDNPTNIRKCHHCAGDGVARCDARGCTNVATVLREGDYLCPDCVRDSDAYVAAQAVRECA